MSKVNEREKNQAQISATIAFVFYGVTLFIYSMYLFINKGELGVPFIILNTGLVIFFASNLIFRRKSK